MATSIPAIPIRPSGLLGSDQLRWGESAVATASGMSAMLALCLTHLKTGDHVLWSRDVFGVTLGLVQNTLQKFGVEVSFMPLTDPDQWLGAGKPDTRMLCICAPSNPLNAVADIAALAQLSRYLGAILTVDNCFCSPALQMPLLLGADIVTHSDTKYLDGQGRVLGGALVGAEELLAPVLAINRSCGPTISVFNAWVMLKGLETLDLRMRAHSEYAQKPAEQSPVKAVHYCGLPDHPGHALARCQQHGFGGVLGFEVAGGREAAWQFINGTQLMSLTAELSDAKTTIVHPASTTHGRLTAGHREAAVISQGCCGLQLASKILRISNPTARAGLLR